MERFINKIYSDDSIYNCTVDMDHLHTNINFGTNRFSIPLEHMQMVRGMIYDYIQTGTGKILFNDPYAFNSITYHINISDELDHCEIDCYLRIGEYEVTHSGKINPMSWILFLYGVENEDLQDKRCIKAYKQILKGEYQNI